MTLRSFDEIDRDEARRVLSDPANDFRAMRLKLGCSAESVYRLKIELGLGRAPGRQPTIDRDQVVLLMFDPDVSNAEICRIAGVAPTQLVSMRRRYSIPRYRADALKILEGRTDEENAKNLKVRVETVRKIRETLQLAEARKCEVEVEIVASYLRGRLDAARPGSSASLRIARALAALEVPRPVYSDGTISRVGARADKPVYRSEDFGGDGDGV